MDYEKETELAMNMMNLKTLLLGTRQNIDKSDGVCFICGTDGQEGLYFNYRKDDALTLTYMANPSKVKNIAKVPPTQTIGDVPGFLASLDCVVDEAHGHIDGFFFNDEEMSLVWGEKKGGYIRLGTHKGDVSFKLYKTEDDANNEKNPLWSILLPTHQMVVLCKTLSGWASIDEEATERAEFEDFVRKARTLPEDNKQEMMQALKSVIEEDGDTMSELDKQDIRELYAALGDLDEEDIDF